MSSSDELKKQFVAILGKEVWNDGWEQMLRFSPEVFKASLELHSVPVKKKYLSPKIQHLIALAVDCASTHLYAPGIREKVKASLTAGASIAEITEVVELTSTLGIHACNIGVPFLVEVMKEQGVYKSHPSSGGIDDRRKKLQAEFTKNRGVPWLKDVKGDAKIRGALEPKVKELVYCAFDAASTHLYVPGLKLHMKNAVGYGAAPEEIMEMLEIATLLSLHTAEITFPILAQCIDKKA